MNGMTRSIVQRCFAALSLGAVSASALGAIVMQPAVNYPVGIQPDGVALGDINGDSVPDMVVSSDNPDKLTVFNGSASGVFTPGQVVFLPVSSSPGQLVAGDLDGDGDTDFAVALKDFSQVLTILNAGGVLGTGTSFSVGANPRGMSIGDLDNDGDLDIAVANRDSNTATVLRNNGSASFVSTSLTLGNEPRDVAMGDFNSDGLLDLAATNHDDRTVSIFTNSGAAFVNSATLVVSGVARPEGIVAADLNADGVDDLAVGANGNGFNLAIVILSTGTGFSAAVGYPTGGVSPSDVQVGFFDAGASPDLALVNEDSAQLSLLPNLGNGTFGAATLVTVGTTPEILMTGDLNGDGGWDAVTVNRDSGNVSVVLNDACLLAADLSGDGSVGQLDLNLLLAAFGTCPGDAGYDAAADGLAGDACVDQLDLNIVLSAFGTACP